MCTVQMSILIYVNNKHVYCKVIYLHMQTFDFILTCELTLKKHLIHLYLVACDRKCTCIL